MIENIVIIDKTKKSHTYNIPRKKKYHGINFSNYFTTLLLLSLTFFKYWLKDKNILWELGEKIRFLNDRFEDVTVVEIYNLILYFKFLI